MKKLVKNQFKFILLLSVFCISNSGYAAQAEITDPLKHGEQTHKNHCYKCHNDDIYTRSNRFVKSIDALSKQVVRCKESNDIPWFDEDADAVVKFLNTKYYKF